MADSAKLINEIDFRRELLIEHPLYFVLINSRSLMITSLILDGKFSMDKSSPPIDKFIQFHKKFPRFMWCVQLFQS